MTNSSGESDVVVGGDGGGGGGGGGGGDGGGGGGGSDGVADMKNVPSKPRNSYVKSFVYCR